MKLQNLAVIFIIIMVPIILIVSYYFDLQKSTLSLQTQYDQKLVEATKEAIQAFEINTTEWNEIYSNLSDSRRRSVMASVNTFITSLSSGLGVSGTAKENIISYLPAMAFTLYDGYYVYAPAHTPEILKYDNTSDKAGQPIYDSSGNLQYTGNNIYEHTLTTYLPYSKKYSSGSDNIIIDYTLDNYIKVYGKIGSEVIEKEGYLVNPANIDITYSGGNIVIKYKNKEIKTEKLAETIMLKNDVILPNTNTGKETMTYTYIYDIQNEKYYWDDIEEKFFRLEKGEKKYLEPVEVGNSSAKYRKIDIVLAGCLIEVYELLNVEGETNREFYVDTDRDGKLDEKIINDGEVITCKNYDGSTSSISKNTLYNRIKLNGKYQDCSARNYYIEAYFFTEWAEDKLDFVKDANGNTIFNGGNYDDASIFGAERREVIKNAVQETLNIAITQYANKTEGYEYKLIQLSETDWDQITRNVSITAFFQGIPIGLKYYNNYAISTSTANNEFVNEDEIYFIQSGDDYYHSQYSSETSLSGNFIGYKNTDFVRKRYENNSDNTLYYYYLHTNSSDYDSAYACYDCLVGNHERGNTLNFILEEAYYTALARERYAQNKNVKQLNGDLKSDIAVAKITYDLAGGGAGSYYIAQQEKVKNIPAKIQGVAENVYTDGFVYWKEKNRDRYFRDIEHTNSTYSPNEISYDDIEAIKYGYNTNLGGIIDTYEDDADLDLEAVYKVKIEYIMGSIVKTDYITSDKQYTIDGSSYSTVWYENPECTLNDHNNGDTIFVKKNLKLYAPGATSVTITYVDEDGVTQLGQETVLQGNPITIKSFTKTGYVLKKWKNILTNDEYSPGTTQTFNQNITLKAEWQVAATPIELRLSNANKYNKSHSNLKGKLNIYLFDSKPDITKDKSLWPSYVQIILEDNTFVIKDSATSNRYGTFGYTNIGGKNYRIWKGETNISTQKYAVIEIGKSGLVNTWLTNNDLYKTNWKNTLLLYIDNIKWNGKQETIISFQSSQWTPPDTERNTQYILYEK